MSQSLFDRSLACEVDDLKIDSKRQDCDTEIRKRCNMFALNLRRRFEDALAVVRSSAEIDHAAAEQLIHEERVAHRKACAALTEAHMRQLGDMQAASIEENREATRTSGIHEETLRLKYESMVVALRERVAHEQGVQTRRALVLQESTSCAETEITRRDVDATAQAEAMTAAKFSKLISRLRKTWEDEEVRRTRTLQERVCSHYAVIIDQIQAQLNLALDLNDDLDQEWIDDVKARNCEHASSMKAFEERCRSLYESRLTAYIESADHRLSECEERLLVSGARAARNSNSMEAKISRLRLACSKWRVDYQREVQRRYYDTTAELEQQYMNEIGALLADLSDASSEISILNTDMCRKGSTLNVGLELKKEIKETPNNSTSPKTEREQLISLWDKLQTPQSDRLAALHTILDAAEYTPELAAGLARKINALSAQLPLIQVITRREFIKYRLSMLSKLNHTGHCNNSHMLTLTRELHKITLEIHQKISRYEGVHNERLFYNGSLYVDL